MSEPSRSIQRQRSPGSGRSVVAEIGRSVCFARQSDAYAGGDVRARCLSRISRLLRHATVRCALVGAFAASLAAIEGGGLRDRTWKYQV